MYARNYTLRHESVHPARLAWRIVRMLERRHAMHFGELCLRLGLTESEVRAELEGMLRRGEVECLRPVGYERGDQDFFRLTGPAPSPNRRGRRQAPVEMQETRECTGRTSDAMAWAVA